MLNLAVAAQLPIIEVTTRDVLNLPEVLKHITGKMPQPWGHAPAKLAGEALYYLVCGKDTQSPDGGLYGKLVAAESTLLLVNPSKPSALAFKAGEVPVPRKLLLKFLGNVVSDQAKAVSLLPALGGCTIKESVEAIRLTMARDKSLTPDGLMLTRKSCFQGARGISQVDTGQPFYAPPDFLQAWVKLEAKFFLNGADRRLIPRGLLMDGPPGVGKTEAAKWLSRQLGVPLYRVDVGGVKNKYVGVSEDNMLSALSQLDNEEPCIALFDEVEKIFARHDGDTSGVTQSLLSQLLWWLAERRTRVLVVMTTNDRSKLPPELYREGRVDAVMNFAGLEPDAALALATNVLGTFKGVSLDAQAIEKAVAGLFKHRHLPTDPPTVAHAAVTKAVFDLIKVKSADKL